MASGGRRLDSSLGGPDVEVGKERSVGQRPVPGPGATSRHARLPTALPALLLVVAMRGWAVPAGAADTPRALSSRRLFDQSRPGVQLITVAFSAGLVVPEATVTEPNGRALEAIVAGRIRRGEIPATQAGFSITPDGYIVTNAHVVAPKDDDIKAAFLAQDIRDEGDDFITDVRQDGLSERQATRFLNALVKWATRNAKLANYQRTISVVGSTGSGASGSSKRRVAKLVDAGEEFPGKDVAIVKVKARNMATVELGDDTALSTGDRLFVLGFPGAATFNPVLSKASQQEPTLTQGVLSAKKQVNGGYTVLQTDAGMTHGNSGGPVFDEQGRVVGVATLGSVDPSTGREISGLNFAVPASIVNELLHHASVTASEGPAGSAYRQALDAIDKQWYKRSLPLLQRVKALDPGHPLASKLIKDAQTAIRQGRDRTPREILGLPVVVFASAAGVAVVVLVGLGVLALRSRRRRRRRQRRREQRAAPAFEPWSVPAPAPTASANDWDAQPGATQPGATQPYAVGTPGDQGDDWWRDVRPRPPVAPATPPV